MKKFLSYVKKILKSDVSWILFYKELIGCFVLCFACINFSCAWVILSWWRSSYWTNWQYSYYLTSSLWNCFFVSSSVCAWNNLKVYSSDVNNNIWDYLFDLSTTKYYCVSDEYVVFKNNRDNYLSCTVYTFNLDNSWWWNSCDYSEYESQISTLSWSLSTCQWLYSSLESDYDLLSWNYLICTSDLNTCIQNWWSSWSGEFQWSSLYINNNQFLWNKNIFVNIPQEINYSYSNTWDNAEIDIVWYNVDTEYIEWIIDIQTNKPDKVDLNNIITWLIPLFVPWFGIILFIYFVFRLIKKIF